MNWQYTDVSMAARAGRTDDLRNQATRHRQVRGLIKENRVRRVRAFRSHFAEWVAALAGLIAPSERQPVKALSTD